MSQPPLVTAVCVTWHGRHVLPALLDSLRRQTCRSLRVIVVDNASTDGSRELLRRDFPEVELLQSPVNLGFGAANNLALRRVDSPYVLLVNDDADLDPDCLAQLVRNLELDPFVGAVAPRIVLRDDPDRIDAAGLAVCPDGLALGRGRGQPADRFAQPDEVFFTSGCCALYRRKMLDDLRIGDETFDNDFFAYAEDTDLGWRARLAGWKALYAPAALCRHCHSASTGSVHPRKAFWVERNRIWVAVKNFPLWLLAWGLAFTLERYFWQTWATLAGQGRPGQFRRQYGALRLAWILLSAHAAALWGLPRMIPKRLALRRKRRLTPRQILDLLSRFSLSARQVALSD